jgi:hypothetical protein
VKHVLRGTFKTFVAASALSLALGAPDALASYGHGLYGEANDKIVTLAGFCIIGFFTVFVIVMSTLQGWLDRRKDARKAAHASLGDGRWRGGW